MLNKIYKHSTRVWVTHSIVGVLPFQLLTIGGLIVLIAGQCAKLFHFAEDAQHARLKRAAGEKVKESESGRGRGKGRGRTRGRSSTICRARRSGEGQAERDNSLHLPIPNGFACASPHVDLLHDLVLDVTLQLLQIVGAFVGIVQLVYASKGRGLTLIEQRQPTGGVIQIKVAHADARLCLNVVIDLQVVITN